MVMRGKGAGGGGGDAGALAGRAEAPVDHFGFVDLEAVVVMRLEARGAADGAADVLGLTAGAADEVMMVVADAVFVTRRGVGWLDAPDDAFVREDVQDVVDRLAGNRAQQGARTDGDFVGGGVRMMRDGPQHRQTLRRDGQVVLAKGGFRVAQLGFSKVQIWTMSKSG